MLASSWMDIHVCCFSHHACMGMGMHLDGDGRSGTRGIESRAVAIDGKAETVKGSNGREKLFGSADSWVLALNWFLKKILSPI